ncbi:hypothetical protein CN878_02590 [Ochrobactrum sp. 695/2009]|nr:hypothetical protein [Brucella intermedia]PJR89993.1 hypothetical protein CN881_12425 [Ochrobactrum sp. 721/2009]PJT14210.1 hypothetical protein CN880_21455 [Ochrobactrum sp. 720/2009]PJT24379.1 hypothetical protein CN879_08485 [Ochrobactrum sp. 715/2009]PJT30296.1 hypothetical protein CN878_02590 [Ochrobactrum sp. 695/2009]PJT33823.1 hypothetical protein CN877_09485 [Ochrobactrum sp. 689/2009]
MQYSSRHELQATAAAHRKKGTSFGQIAELMGITRGHAWSLLSERSPTLPPPYPTEKTVVRRATYNGGYSGGCMDIYVSLPRITILDGPYTGTVH